MTLMKSHFPFSHSPFNLLWDLHSDRFPTTDENAQLSPKVEVHETTDAFVLSAELPGIAKEDIDIKVQDGVLTLKATKKVSEQRDKGTVHYSEVSYGEYARSWKLPKQVDQDNIHASYENGVLHLELKKAEEAKPKEISVSVK